MRVYGGLGSDSVDPDDPTCIAENELFNAAQSIESAAKKLSLLRPRRRVQVRGGRFIRVRVRVA